MRRATSVIQPSDPRMGRATRAITLSRENRYRRRVSWQSDCGEAFLLDLAETTYLHSGCGLLTDDGEIIVVRAAAEQLLRITASAPRVLARIAWHIGNRHTPAEITDDAIFILSDHVLAEMVRGLGGSVTVVSRPFEPEGGAYGGHASLHHDHHHHGSLHHEHH